MEQYIKRENLEKLLEVIKVVCDDPKNQWFKNKLIHEIAPEPNKLFTDKINNIERYLELDGVQSIDFSDIEDQRVREQLIADNIQMQRYRLGKINNKISFEEYCKYAHFQVEELVNYFYSKFFYNIKDVNVFLSLNSDQNLIFLKIEDIPHYRKQICLNHKILSYINDNQVEVNSNFKDVLFKISKIRNQLNHRSTLSIIANDDEIFDQIEKNKINLNANYKIYKGSSFEQLYNDGNLIKFKRESDFKKVVESIYILKNFIVLFLNQKSHLSSPEIFYL